MNMCKHPGCEIPWDDQHGHATTVASPVQAQRGTDERERLAVNIVRSARSVPSVADRHAIADMLRADAEQLRALEAKLLDCQSAIASGDRAQETLRNLLQLGDEQLRARDEEIAGLRKDAERYRWLRNEANTARKSDPMVCLYPLDYKQMRLIDGDELDMAVDAAIEEKSRDAG